LGEHEEDDTKRQHWRDERDDELVDGQQQNAEPAEDAARRLLLGAKWQREENAAQAAHELLLALVFGHGQRDEHEDDQQYDRVEVRRFSERLLDVEAPGEGSAILRCRKFDSTAVLVEYFQTELGGGRVVRAEEQADRGGVDRVGTSHVVWRREGAVGLWLGLGSVG
jgi:hypothetical protein